MRTSRHFLDLFKGVSPLVHGPPGWWRGLHSGGTSKLLVAHPRGQTDPQVQEAVQLARTYTGEECCTIAAGSSRGFTCHPSTYFGSGAVDQIRSHCELQQAQKVFVNAQLSAVQLRNLEAEWGRPVLDRVGLIIEIFAQRARTREARLQVEMAALQYQASRLVRTVDTRTGLRKGFGSGGEVEVVSARERGGRAGGVAGGLGGSAGGGETELQLQKRRIGRRIKVLQHKLDEVRRTRALQRSGRRRLRKPLVGVVGYTSAGKSSLLAAVGDKPMAAKDRLFETLDTAWTRVCLPSGRDVLVSDTVGFISDLPHALVSAFQATLEEVAEADVLLHVLDASASNVAEQRATVYDVLRRLRIPESRLHSKLIEVWNKCDLVPAPSTPSESAAEDADAYRRDAVWKLIQDIRAQQGELQPPAVVTSTVTKQGLLPLLSEIDRMVSVRCAIEDLRFTCSRAGPKALSQNVVGPAMRSPELRLALSSRLPRSQPPKSEHARRLALWQAH